MICNDNKTLSTNQSYYSLSIDYLVHYHLQDMTSTTAKKPRPARRRKAKAVTITSMPVVITKESLTLLDYSILSILYLEKFIKVILSRFSH